MVEEPQQGVVIAFHVEQAAGLGVEAQLAPGNDFAEFLKGAEAPGQGDEAIRQFRHAGLAGVHGIHHFQPGDLAVFQVPPRHFLTHQGLGNDADDLAPRRQTGVGHRAHARHCLP